MGVTARFFNPYGLVADRGNLLITDAYNQTVRLLLGPFPLEVAATADGAHWRLSWESVVGKTYCVQSASRADTGSWTEVGLRVLADGVRSSILFPRTAAPTVFYRVIVRE